MMKKILLPLITLIVITAIGGSLYWMFTPNPVLSVTPAKDAISVDPATKIKVVFIHSLSPVQLRSYSLKLEPAVATTYQVSKIAADTLEFTSSEPLAKGTFYTVSVYQGQEKLYSWNFLTASLDENAVNQQLQQQLPNEETTGNFFKGYYEDKPFIKNLPISTEDFLIVYSSESNLIVVGIKHEGTLEDLQSQYQAKALDLLKAAGVDPLTQSIEWKVLKKA